MCFFGLVFSEHTFVFPNWKQKIHFSKFFRIRLIVPKELSARKTTFFEAEIRYESGRVSFDQMKVSEKHTEPKISFNKIR